MDNKDTKMFVPDVYKYAQENYNTFFNEDGNKLKIQEGIEEAITMSYIAAQKAGLPQEEIEKLAERVNQDIKDGNYIANHFYFHLEPDQVITRIWYINTVNAINEYTHDKIAGIEWGSEDDYTITLFVDNEYIGMDTNLNDNNVKTLQEEKNKKENLSPVTSGTYANVDWRITEDNEIIFGNGKEQTFLTLKEIWGMEPGYFKDALPDEYRNKIEKISFDGIVHTKSTMPYIFMNMQNVKEIDIKGLDTKNLQNGNNMFAHCYKLEKINISELNTENMEDIGGMFYNCKSLKSIDFSTLDTKNVKSMDRLFTNCSKLQSVNMENMNTQKLEHTNKMFKNCISLTDVNLNGIDTLNMQSMGEMFMNCKLLETLDLSSFNTKNVKGMQNMFAHCMSLSYLNIPNFSTENVQAMKNMFLGCNKLKDAPQIVYKQKVDLEKEYTTKEDIEIKEEHVPTKEEIENEMYKEIFDKLANGEMDAEKFYRQIRQGESIEKIYNNMTQEKPYKKEQAEPNLNDIFRQMGRKERELYIKGFSINNTISKNTFDAIEQALLNGSIGYFVDNLKIASLIKCAECGMPDDKVAKYANTPNSTTQCLDYLRYAYIDNVLSDKQMDILEKCISDESLMIQIDNALRDGYDEEKIDVIVENITSTKMGYEKEKLLFQALEWNFSAEKIDEYAKSDMSTDELKQMLYHDKAEEINNENRGYTVEVISYKENSIYDNEEDKYAETKMSFLPDFVKIMDTDWWTQDKLELISNAVLDGYGKEAILAGTKTGLDNPFNFKTAFLSELKATQKEIDQKDGKKTGIKYNTMDELIDNASKKHKENKNHSNSEKAKEDDGIILW